MTLNTLSSDCLSIFIDKCSFGRGVFASENITKGEVILTFSGKIITLDEALAKGETSGNAL